MAKSHTLQIGRSKVKLSRSDTQIAVRPQVGMAQSMENALRSATRDTPVERRGRLGGFELVQIDASPARVSRARSILREAASVDQEVAVYHTSKDNVPFVPAGTIYLSFKPGQSDAVRQRVLDKHGLELVASERNGFLTVRVTGPGSDAVEVAARLQREKSVAVAEPDLVTTRRLRNFVRPDDELLAREWHLENTGALGEVTAGLKQGADARVIAAWKLLDGLGSDQVVVGVIDDGFDLSHPDLANKAVSPWDFDRNSADVHPAPDLTNPDNGNWHGTACAAVAVGNGGGGQIVGAAPNARLLPVRMNESLWPSLVAQWFDHMTDEGAWVVSCSWGAEAEVYPLPDRIAHAIARCAREGRNGKGCVVLFAAGNSGSDIDDPPRSLNGLAAHPDVMAISASTSRDQFPDYSNFGKNISVCAPTSGLGGWGICTADVTGSYIDAAGRERSSGYVAGDYNEHFGRTSSACPLAAGVCALVLSANPDLTSAEVREIVKRTARKVGPPSEYRNGHSVKFGFGCVDAEAAVQEALRVAPPAAAPARHEQDIAPAAAAPEARGRAPAAARAGARGAVPNLFEFIIEEALAAPDATVESVAAAIARSQPFLTAVQLGMTLLPPDGGIPSRARMTRVKLAKAFSAPTSGTMF